MKCVTCWNRYIAIKVTTIICIMRERGPRRTFNSSFFIMQDVLIYTSPSLSFNKWYQWMFNTRTNYIVVFHCTFLFFFTYHLFALQFIVIWNNICFVAKYPTISLTLCTIKWIQLNFIWGVRLWISKIILAELSLLLNDKQKITDILYFSLFT